MSISSPTFCSKLLRTSISFNSIPFFLTTLLFLVFLTSFGYMQIFWFCFNVFQILSIIFPINTKSIFVLFPPDLYYQIPHFSKTKYLLYLIPFQLKTLATSLLPHIFHRNHFLHVYFLIHQSVFRHVH